MNTYDKKLAALEKGVLSYINELGNTPKAARKIIKMITEELDLAKGNSLTWPVFKSKRTKKYIQEKFTVWEHKIQRFAKRQAFYTMQGVRRKFPGNYEDIYQECVNTFIECINKFDEENDYLPFETRLFTNMKWAMHRYFSNLRAVNTVTHESYDAGIKLGRESRYIDDSLEDNYYNHDDHFS